MEYFAQDEATRLNPALTVYETLEAGSAHSMVPAIRNILGGFLFSGDDVYKKASCAVRGRTHEAGRGAHAATSVQHAAAGRTDEPPRPGLERRVPGGARGLRRHARHRVARSLLRREDSQRKSSRSAMARVPSTQARTMNSSGTRSTRRLDRRPGRAGAGARERPPARGLKPQAQSPKPQSPKPSAQTPRAQDPAKTASAKKPNAASRQRAVDALRKRIADLESRIAEREGQVQGYRSLDGRRRASTTTPPPPMPRSTAIRR